MLNAWKTNLVYPVNRRQTHYKYAPTSYRSQNDLLSNTKLIATSEDEVQPSANEFPATPYDAYEKTSASVHKEFLIERKIRVPEC